MATNDITVGSASYSWDGKDIGSNILHQRIAATVAKPLVNGDTYQIFHIPAGAVCRAAWYIIRTLDAGGGTITVNATSTGTVAMLTTQATSGAAGSGIFPAAAAVYGGFPAAGTIDIVIGAANLTTAVFDLFVEIARCDVTAQAAAATIYAS